MSNTMNVSYMTRVYNNFINNYKTQNSPKSTTTFADKVTEKREEAKMIRNMKNGF